LIENGGAQEEAENSNINTIRRREKLIYPMIHIKRVIIDSSDLRIMRVSSQTVAFRRDLRIRGLRSTIRATDQKVNFGSTPEVSLNQLKFFLGITFYPP
jgi:hypothetical protein